MKLVIEIAEVDLEEAINALPEPGYSAWVQYYGELRQPGQERGPDWTEAKRTLRQALVDAKEAGR